MLYAKVINALKNSLSKVVPRKILTIFLIRKKDLFPQWYYSDLVITC